MQGLSPLQSADALPTAGRQDGWARSPPTLIVRNEEEGTRRAEAATEAWPPALVSWQTYLGRLQEVTWSILENKMGMESQTKSHAALHSEPFFLSAPHTI